MEQLTNRNLIDQMLTDYIIETYQMNRANYSSYYIWRKWLYR